MRFQPIDQFATTLPPDKRASVYQSTKATHEKRTKLLFDQFADPNRLRALYEYAVADDRLAWATGDLAVPGAGTGMPGD